MEFPRKDGGIWLSAALEHVRDGVIGIDTAGGIVWMNPAAERLVGRKESLAAGRPVGDLSASLEGEGYNSLWPFVKNVLNDGTKMQESRHKLIYPGSRPVFIDFTIAPVLMSGECRGAVIVLSPLASADIPDAGARSEIQGQKPSGHGLGDAGRVLVMDDDDVVRNMTIQRLVRLGYESEGALNGEEALRKFQAARDSGKPFDVVILDLIVRGGMGGREAIAALRNMDPGVKAILTSGHAADPVLTNFWEYGFAGVVRKPFVIKELGVVIRQVLEEE